MQQKAAADVLVQLEEGPEAGAVDHYRAVFDALTGVPERFVVDSEAPGGARRFDVYAFRLGDEPSRRVAVHLTDVTERTLTEQELLDRTEQFGSLIAQAPLGVFLVDSAFRLVLVNPVAEEVFSAVPNVLDRAFDDVMRLVWREELAADVIGAFRRTLETGAPSGHEDLATADGEHGVSAYYDWRIDRVLLPDGQYGVVCSFSNVSPLVEARRALAASGEQFRSAFETMDQGFCIVQVLYDDADRPVDDRYLVPQLEDAHDVETLARKILAEVALPVQVDGRAATVSASIGVSIYPEHAHTAHALFHAADAAMYLAKASGRNAVRVAMSAMKARPTESVGSC